MDLDFALILTVAVLVAGALWALDAAVLKRFRTESAKDPIVIEYAKSFFPVLFVVWALRSFLVEPFTIPSGLSYYALLTVPNSRRLLADDMGAPPLTTWPIRLIGIIRKKVQFAKLSED